jgi:hypothetical protein
MGRQWMIIIALFIGIGLTTPAWVQDTGIIPVPVFTKAGVGADVTYGSGTGLYTFSYTIANPASNTGEIWSINIDIRQPRDGTVLSSDGLTIPRGSKTRTFDEVLSIRKNPVPMVPVGIGVPPGWDGVVGARGFAGFSSKNDFPNILPGETKGGFQLISRGLPTIRSIEIQPWWILQIQDFASNESTAIGRATTKSLKFTTKTLGPTAPPQGFVPVQFLNTIQGYMDESVTLGWLIDPALVNALRAKLDTVRSFIQANDPSSAKVVLGEFMDLITQSSSSQLTPEARGLLFYNAQYLKNQLPNTYIPPVKTLSLTPENATLPIGVIHTLTVMSKIDDNPLPHCPVIVQVTTGPNAGLALAGDSYTDNNGHAVFTYTSKKVGTDRLIAQARVIPASAPLSRGVLLAMNEVRADIVPALVTTFSSYHIARQGEIAKENQGVPETMILASDVFKASAEVTWSGGPDLTIPLFVPPIIKSAGGRPIFITEITKNTGTIAAGPSVTRYFISANPVIQPDVDRPLGERMIPALEPGQSSQVTELKLLIPNDIPAGTYYCGACADADDTVVELDEGNNCVNNEVAIVVPVASPNQPPDCTKAQPSVDLLWPPNHKLVTISILGVTDSDGDPVSITVTGITQDEPVNGLGDGDTSPDGFGIGTAQAQIRAERSGTGNGRVYAITFTADDGKGGVCTGRVTVGVPHDQGKGKIPIDDGQHYDSTQP